MKKFSILLALALLAGCQSVQNTLDQTVSFTKDLVTDVTTTDEESTNAAATTTSEPAAAPTLTRVAAVRPAPANAGDDVEELNLAADLPPSPTTEPVEALAVNDQPYAQEAHNAGVPPVSSLLPGNYVGWTPTTLGGGTIISTYQLHQFLKRGAPVVMINTLEGDLTEVIPGSVWLSGAGANGTFWDATQSEFEAKLEAITGGNRDTPLVFYCLDAQCWYAYNASMRAIMMRYNNVYWYRGGLMAWNSAGLPHVPTREDRW